MIQITIGRKTLVALGAVAVFALGCAARPLIVPPANADQAGPQKWEHLCFEAHDHKKAMEVANQAGSEGYEIVAGSGAGNAYYYWCMKRPKG